jgi:xylulokinase
LVAGGHDHPVAALAIHALRPNARIDSLGTANVIYADAPSFEITALDEQIAFMASIHGPGRLACLGVFEFNEALKSFRGGIDGVNLVLEFDRIPGEPGNLKGAPFFGARSILEWSTFQSMKLFSRIAELGVPSAPIYATGGWSRFPSLIELRASMYGEPIYVPDEHELTVVGACILAAMPTGRELTFDCNIAVIEPYLPWAEAYREIALEAVMREIQIDEK